MGGLGSIGIVTCLLHIAGPGHPDIIASHVHLQLLTNLILLTYGFALNEQLYHNGVLFV